MKIVQWIQQLRWGYRVASTRSEPMYLPDIVEVEEDE